MKYADRFSGHLSPDDPRTPVTAAGGCTWPTIPAYRYWLTSDDATGIFSFLNTEGILYQQSGTPPGHDRMKYTGIKLTGWTPSTYLIRDYSAEFNNIMWHLYLHHKDCYFEINSSGIQQPGKCNVDIPIFEFDCLWGNGTSGKTCRLEQVEFDKDKPPGWMPPA